jgi:septum formation protein
MNLILGSQSPRRKEILGFFSLPFAQKSPDFDEASVPFNGDPDSYVCTVAHGKALSLAEHYPHDLILTADTEVYREGKIFGKPKDETDAMRMLRELSGHWHSVHTGLTLRRGHVEYTACEETRVLFTLATDKQLQHYLKSVHSTDKAGGYAIQNNGSVIVQRIEGCYYNVMGMPIHTLCKLLHRFDIDLWEHLG